MPIRIDGQPRAASDLKIGHVVQVVAENHNGVLTTGRIDVTSEVVGTVEVTGGKVFRVLGQPVSTEKLSGPQPWRRGERVAVFGLRRPDGIIVASLIERRAEGPDRVAGRMIKLRDGSLRIGSLRLAGANPALAGTRAVLEGTHSGGVLDVTRAAHERDLLGPVRQVLYRGLCRADAKRAATRFRSRGGGNAPVALPAGSYAPAVVTACPIEGGC